MRLPTSVTQALLRTSRHRQTESQSVDVRWARKKQACGGALHCACLHSSLRLGELHQRRRDQTTEWNLDLNYSPCSLSPCRSRRLHGRLPMKSCFANSTTFAYPAARIASVFINANFSTSSPANTALAITSP